MKSKHLIRLTKIVAELALQFVEIWFKKLGKLAMMEIQLPLMDAQPHVLWKVVIHVQFLEQLELDLLYMISAIKHVVLEALICIMDSKNVIMQMVAIHGLIIQIQFKMDVTYDAE